METTREQEEAVTREIDSHDEARHKAIENSRCLRCKSRLLNELHERNITFRCSDPACNWHVIYPIRTIGNSERALRDVTLDLVAISEREVLSAAKQWSKQVKGVVLSTERRLWNAIILLESREALLKGKLGSETKGNQ